MACSSVSAGLVILSKWYSSSMILFLRCGSDQSSPRDMLSFIDHPFNRFVNDRWWNDWCSCECLTTLSISGRHSRSKLNMKISRALRRLLDFLAYVKNFPFFYIHAQLRHFESPTARLIRGHSISLLLRLASLKQVHDFVPISCHPSLADILSLPLALSFTSRSFAVSVFLHLRWLSDRFPWLMTKGECEELARARASRQVLSTFQGQNDNWDLKILALEKFWFGSRFSNDV